MKLYIMRHGKAAPAVGFDLAADVSRPLTETGRAQVVQVINQRKFSLAEVELVLASPYLRARQTAQLAIDQLDVGLQLLISDCLTPDGEPSEVFAFIDQLDAEAILIASHMPLVGALVESLSAGGGAVTMGTAWLAALETQALVPGFADLLWLEKPGGV